MTKIDRGPEITIRFDGTPIAAHAGESLLAALLRAGQPRLRTGPDGAPRGGFCLMGACQECRVTIEGRAERACRYLCHEGLEAASPDVAPDDHGPDPAHGAPE